MATSDRPQLKMSRSIAEGVTPSPLATGYTHRLAEPADAAALGELLTVAFGFDWDVARTRAELLDSLEVIATHLVLRDDRVVATASAYLPAWAEPGEGYLHWVAAHPGESRRGLGRFVTARALASLVEHGCQTASLTTDDDRVPAIVSYLREGFAPAMWHESHPARWEIITRDLREPVPVL